MRRAAIGLLSVLVLALETSTVSASGPRVPGFERSLAAGNDQIRNGWLLLGELNCVACHAADKQIGILAKQAPRLDEVGARVRPEFLREFLTNPPQTDVGTTMPHVLHGASEQERRRQVEALVHFLGSTGQVSQAAPVSAGVHRGRQLFHNIGCVACHDPQDPAQTLSTSIPLTSLSRKYSILSLTKFLQDPLRVRPSGRMPQLNLTAEEARDIACFLLRDLRIPTSMTFQYYEGNWEKLPDFSQLPVKASGGASSFDVNVGADDHFAVRFQGKFRVEKDGQYRFFLSSDDGSRLIIDGREVLVNDGIHATTEQDAKVPLSAGEHDFVAEYFEGGGEQELRIEYQGPGVKQQSLEFALVAPQDSAGTSRFVPDPALAQQGRELFQEAGCAACHEFHVADRRLLARHPGRKLSELTNGGCLAEQPGSGVPSFGLTPQQRSALTQALAALRSGAPPTLGRPEDRVAQALTTFNCIACHERSGSGGVEEARNSLFRTNQPEMGDEGRLPPTLDGVGAKLRPEWLKHLIEKGAKDRPYMFTRMPRFGDANLGSLAATVVELDRAAASELAAVTPQAPQVPERKLKAIGRQLVGERGMSCVKCHTWDKVKASGIQAISLTTMTRRLDPNWFRQYLFNPQVYRRGTRMPAAWPNGQTPFADILDGDALQQIHAVWTFLSDGNDAVMPIGIGEQPIELVVDKEPIIYRNFLEGAGTRAIGVGYPEHANIAFDANNCRLALLWQGAFMDAAMHWTGRGQGFQKPLGDNALTLTEGVPLAVLKSLDEPWPNQSARELGIAFSGYRLDAQRRPVFQYRWQKVQIEDATVPTVVAGSARLQRSIQIGQRLPDGSWFRAGVGDKIEALADGWYVFDGDWRMRVRKSGGSPMVRVSQGKHELLVPATGAGAVTIEITYAW